MKKRSATVVLNPNRQGMVTIYLKGAPEIVLPMCSTVQTSNGVAQLDEKLQDEIYKEIVKMAAQPLRTLCFAYLEMDQNTWETKFENQGKEFEQALDDNTFQFTFVGAFGLKDRLRSNVKSVVNAVQNVS